MKKTGPFQETSGGEGGGGKKNKQTSRRRPGLLGTRARRGREENLTVDSFRTLQDLRGTRQAQSRPTVIETNTKKRKIFDGQTPYTLNVRRSQGPHVTWVHTNSRP